jgi:zinc/manganese transport system ATP-binding protein
MSARLHNLTLGYARHPAVHHLDGAIAKSGLLAVVGPNGAGKSTLLKGLAGTIRPLEGKISWDGVKKRDIAWLPQAAEIDRRVPVTAFELVSSGLWHSIGSFGAIGRKQADKIEVALSAVGLSGFEDRLIGEMSGGQLQRILFARVLVQDARVILLDEPFAAIDARTTGDLVDLVCRWGDEGRCVVAAIHDIDLARDRFPQTLLLAREAVAWGPTHDALAPANLLRARAMAEAWSDKADPCSGPTSAHSHSDVHEHKHRGNHA